MSSIAQLLADDSVKSGELTRRITIQAPGPRIPDGKGGSKGGINWQTIATSVPAKITWYTANRNDEKYIGQRLEGTRVGAVKIRYRSQNIDNTMRILYGSLVFDIRVVQVPDESQKAIIMLVEEHITKGSNHS